MGARRHDFFTRSKSPQRPNRRHAGRTSAVHVCLAVTQKNAVFRADPDFRRHRQRPIRSRFPCRLRPLAANHGPRPAGQQRLNRHPRKPVRLVGIHRDRQTGRHTGVQQTGNSFIRPGLKPPPALIDRQIRVIHRIHRHRIPRLGGRYRALGQHLRSVTDFKPVSIKGMHRKPERPQRIIHGIGQILEGVEQCTIKITKKQRRHRGL